MEKIFFWWSIISTVVNVVLLYVSIWQILENRSQKERSKSQVKIWMQDAQGIKFALGRTVRDNLDKRYSTTDDVCNTVWAIESMAQALYQSLYEERCVDEKEYKVMQKEFAEIAKKNTIIQQATSSIEKTKGI